MASTPEVKVKKQIRKLLDEAGAYYAMPIGTGYGNSGVPDFLCCFRGVFWAVETKAPGKRGNTTVLQQRQIADICSAGGRAVVIDDVKQLEELMK